MKQKKGFIAIDLNTLKYAAIGLSSRYGVDSQQLIWVENIEDAALFEAEDLKYKDFYKVERAIVAEIQNRPLKILAATKTLTVEIDE